jgi:hypothetical protein
MGKEVLIRREWAMPNADTCAVPVIAELVQRWLKGREVVVDPFARNCTIGTIRNDLNPDTAAQHHMKADEFAKMLSRDGVECDAILFDPPYSLEQCKRSYESVGVEFTQRDGQIVNRWTSEKDYLARTLRVGGVAISMGWNSTGFGTGRGFALRELLVVCHGAGHNDTIVTVEEKVADQAELFARESA